MIIEHDRLLKDKESGVLKQLENMRLTMTDFVSKKAVFATVISCLFIAGAVGTYMFSLDKKIVRIEEQLKILNENIKSFNSKGP